MNESIAEVTNEVLTIWEGHIGTHYDGCWKSHVACLASLIRNLNEDGD